MTVVKKLDGMVIIQGDGFNVRVDSRLYDTAPNKVRFLNNELASHLPSVQKHNEQFIQELQESISAFVTSERQTDPV